MTEQAKEKKKDVEACILRVRAREQAAFVELLSWYEPLITAQVSRHVTGVVGEEREELHQIATVAFYRAVMAYDLEQSGVEFGLYAKICISNALNSHLRALRRRVPEASVELLGEMRDIEDPAAQVIAEESFDTLVARIRALLSPYENRVWTLYVAGHSTGNIARLLQKDPHSIENAVYRIRRKLREALGDGMRN